MKVLVLGLLLFVVLFVSGLVAPRRSRRLQGWVDRLLRRGERKSQGSAGRAGDWTRRSLRRVRKGSDKSARAGRRTRSKLPV